MIKNEDSWDHPHPHSTDELRKVLFKAQVIHIYS